MILTTNKAKGFPAKVLRLDNAGEWVWLKPVCAKHGGITMQFTSPHTPQHNAIVECKFPTIRNMAYACLQSSGMTEGEQMLHWAHAIDDCTIVRNLQPRKEWKNAYEPFNEEPPVKPQDMIPWGDMVRALVESKARKRHARCVRCTCRKKYTIFYAYR
jgi:hypothetical protein